MLKTRINLNGQFATYNLPGLLIVWFGRLGYAES